jgi:hypothetical protein
MVASVAPVTPPVLASGVKSFTYGRFTVRVEGDIQVVEHSPMLKKEMPTVLPASGVTSTCHLRQLHDEGTHVLQAYGRRHLRSNHWLRGD